MASSREVRRRIKSVTNIGQITKAMELVAASRLRRAQESALASRRYTQTLDQMVEHLVRRTDPENHPLLQQNDSSKVLMVVFGPDKGLCGALITNLLREVAHYKAQGADIEYVTMGKRAREIVRKLGGSIVADVPLHEKPRLSDVTPLTKIVVEDYGSGNYGQVVIAYTDFVSVLRQQAQVKPLLPLDTKTMASLTSQDNQPQAEYLYEPSADEVLSQLLPRYVELSVYQALLEALASEYAARMMAMKNAGDNANDLKQELTLTYNQLRQASITAELAEIASGASV
jgi:F-type H+-transporting ATPase subunit gamma